MCEIGYRYVNHSGLALGTVYVVDKEQFYSINIGKFKFFMSFNSHIVVWDRVRVSRFGPRTPNKKFWRVHPSLEGITAGGTDPYQSLHCLKMFKKMTKKDIHNSTLN